MPEPTSKPPTLLERAIKLDEKLKDHYGKPEFARTLAARGTLRTEVGSDYAGVRDLLVAHAFHYEYHGEIPELTNLKDYAAFRAVLLDLKPEDLVFKYLVPKLAKLAVPTGAWNPDAELAEALRIHARDSLLSVGPKTDNSALVLLVDVSKASGMCFERALLNLDIGTTNQILTSEKARRLRAWLYAHIGALAVLQYWMRRSSSVNTPNDVVADTLFDRADNAFTLAIEEQPHPYTWAMRFKAFLLALRGGPRTPVQMSDFRRARNMLRNIEGDSPSLDTSLERARSMLLSYDIQQAPIVNDPASKLADADRIEAARSAIDAGSNAGKRDADEYHGPYYATLGLWHLYRTTADGAEKDFYHDALQSSLRGAEVRARNAFSQSLATLASLEDLRELMEGKVHTDFRDMLSGLTHGLDLETRAIFIRDPLSQFIVNDTGLNLPLADGRKAEMDARRKKIQERFAISAKVTAELLKPIPQPPPAAQPQPIVPATTENTPNVP